MKRLGVALTLSALLLTACGSSKDTGLLTTPGTDVPTSDVAQTTTPAESTTAPPTTAPFAEYTPAEAPTVPGTTQAINADNTHPDGVYYGSEIIGGDPPPAAGAVVFELVQLFTGPDCAAKFGTDDENVCLNGYDIINDPVSTIEVPLTDQYITVVLSDTQASYQVSAGELLRLMSNQPPAAGAPAGYEYVIFGYFITFKDGKVTRLEQWWTP